MSKSLALFTNPSTFLDSIFRNMENQLCTFGTIPNLEGIWNSTETGYELTLEMPGFKSEEIDVSVTDGVLKVSAKSERKGKRSYSGSWSLPKNADSSRIEAVHEDGLLTLTVAKLSETKETSRKITIKTV